jgi:hypothetical protein
MIDNREEFCWRLRDEAADGVIFCAETGIPGSVENIHTDE